jgi:tellurite methyltransferase
MSDADRSRWETHYRAAGQVARQPSRFLVAQAALLPHRGRALDVAGGAGRHALWLARRGLDVTICDISESALTLAREAAEREGLRIETVAIDLELAPLPSGPWDAIVSVDYLQRDLFAQLPERLSPGGVLVFTQPTRKNLERHPKPGSSYLLEPGELERLVHGLDVLHYEESWLDDRHEARLIAKKL